MYKQQLIESLEYIQIKRGPSRPLPLDKILSTRMEYFTNKRLARMRSAGKERARQ